MTATPESVPAPTLPVTTASAPAASGATVRGVAAGGASSGLGGLSLLLMLSLLMLSLLLVSAVAAPASAHTDLLRGSPGPAQRAGGTVDFIDLVFLESVTEFDLTVEDPNGDLLDGRLSSTQGQLFRFELDRPITETGRYVVRYTMISADGDDTATGYFFTYEQSAPQPLPLGEVDVPDTGMSILAVVSGVVFVACLIGLAFLFLLRIERNRATAAAAGVDDDTEARELAE